MTQKQFAAITSDRHREVLEAMLPQNTLYYIDSNPNVRGKLSEWEEINVDVVVVDDDGMPYKDISENDLYTYPATAKRKMQIIFIPAPERELNDPFLGRLVHVGIYDIVSPRFSGVEARQAITHMIEHPSMLSDALTYFDEAATPFNSGKIKRHHRRQRKPFLHKELPASADLLARSSEDDKKDDAGSESAEEEETEGTATPGADTSKADVGERACASVQPDDALDISTPEPSSHKATSPASADLDRLRSLVSKECPQVPPAVPFSPKTDNTKDTEGLEDNQRTPLDPEDLDTLADAVAEIVLQKIESRLMLPSASGKEPKSSCKKSNLVSCSPLLQERTPWP